MVRMAVLAVTASSDRASRRGAALRTRERRPGFFDSPEWPCQKTPTFAAFDHTRQADENHAWTAIELSNVADAYVRGVACAHLGFSCVHAKSSSKAVTVENCTSVEPVSLICTPPLLLLLPP